MPWELFAYKDCESRSEAMLFEKKLKNLKSRSKLFEFIKKYKFSSFTNNQ